MLAKTEREAMRKESGGGSEAKEEDGQNGAGVAWTPSKEQFCQEKAPWVPDFGTCVEGERFVAGTMGERVAKL
jgi:hypothetical protein